MRHLQSPVACFSGTLACNPPSPSIHSFMRVSGTVFCCSGPEEKKGTMLNIGPSVSFPNQSASISSRNSCCTMHFAEIQHKKFLHKAFRGPFIKSFLQCDLQNSSASPKPPLVCFEWVLQHFEKAVVLNVRVYIFFPVRRNQMFSVSLFRKRGCPLLPWNTSQSWNELCFVPSYQVAWKQIVSFC